MSILNLDKGKELNQFWSIIPARSNSKSIKKKNLRKINNKTLIQLAINVSKKSKFIKRTFVSTDSKSILKKSIKWGSEMCELRQKKNARDNSTDLDVIKDFFNSWFKKNSIFPKYVILLRPTTPIRRFQLINKAINKFKKIKGYQSMISVNRMSEPAFKKMLIKKNILIPLQKKKILDDVNKPRQLFPQTFSANGYFDIIKTKNILSNTYFGKKCYPFLIKQTIDIDTINDLNLAKLIFNNKSKFSNLYEI